MKTALDPIIKNNTGDKNNYRPIALVTAASKNFEICLLEILEMYLITHDHQFGFKSKHSADMCIFSAKSIMKYYTEHGSAVFTSRLLVMSNVGCYTDGKCMNHLMYAEWLMPLASQYLLLDLCYVQT